MKLLQGRVAIISGASHPKGIGKATARLFLEHGARVAILDLNEDAIRESAHDLGGNESSLLPLTCDVGDPEQCARAVDSVRTWSASRIDILVNNAAITQKAVFQDIADDDFDRLVRVNLKGVFNLSKATVPFMIERSAGSIISISSLSAQNGGGVFGGAHYCAAKAGVQGLTRAMARELGAHNIRANAIAPGLITTDFSRTGRSDESKDQAAQHWPLQRAGRPHEIAGGCLFLASDLSSYVTGTTLDINGGAHMN
ncbi:SDR family NAD(P)-dependent oxidoreductase [Bordetella genomosp. 4]|uniref:Short-chain dehydrogenase n=1 Tax=Bordetella genomosp. 4 TaxID=463044 RepID=A0A261U733_9BORD|nr:SDR family NAD(P)-dependent oxidoreductase [Bordetella genomosp. 4]OZI48637.1 short-chain dehydrogenase [Bordetella genomosp. 4]OZI56663.1 short-chain dehydrogenase [Bordetella genomosp. 4]